MPLGMPKQRACKFHGLIVKRIVPRRSYLYRLPRFFGPEWYANWTSEIREAMLWPFTIVTWIYWIIWQSYKDSNGWIINWRTQGVCRGLVFKRILRLEKRPTAKPSTQPSNRCRCFEDDRLSGRAYRPNLDMRSVKIVTRCHRRWLVRLFA